MFQHLTPPFILSILIALSVHEWAHGQVAYWLGDPTAKYEGRLTLNPIAHLDPLGTLMFFIIGFGWGKPVPVNPRYFKHYKRDTALVSLAGPASNLILAIIAFFLLVLASHFMSQDTGSIFARFVNEFLKTSVGLNLGLMAFNLLPVAPLDGSKILAVFVPLQYEGQYDEYMRYGPYVLLGLLLLERVINFSLLSWWISLITDPIVQMLTALAGLFQ